MTELDAFERSLETALRAFADRGVTPVDAAEFAAGSSARPRRRTWLAWSPGSLGGRSTARLVILAAAVVALLLAAVAGAIIGARDPDLAPWTPLQPTGIQVLTPESTDYDRVVVDGTGAYWAIGPGHLTRFDPATGERTTWTVSDDAALGGDLGSVTPAGAGGVWMEWAGGFRRFDGTAFRESIPSPGDGPAPEMSRALPFEEAPDGTPWSLSLRRWDGSAWLEPPAGGPAWVELETGRGGLAAAGQQSPRVLTRDGIWVGSGPTVAHLADGRWTTYGPADTGLHAELTAVAEAGDGSIWLLSSDGRVARFDGRTWATVDGPQFATGQLVGAPDGSVWATMAYPATALARYDGTRWTSYGQADGLTGALGLVSPTPAGAFVSTDGGLMRLAGDRWVPAWPEVQPGPREPDELAVISADEAWVADGGMLWHYLDDRWQGPTAPADLAIPGASIEDVAVAPEGSVWVTEGEGVAVLQDGAWRTVAGPPALAGAIAPDASGTVWASVGNGSSGAVIAVSDDPAVPMRRFDCPNPAARLAVASDGSVYVAGSWQDYPSGDSGPVGLSRISGTTCEAVDVLGDGTGHDVWSIVAGPAGRLAALVSEPDGGRATVLFDGAGWTVIGRDGGSGLFFDGQGRLWRMPTFQGQRFERFDGSRWTEAGSALLRTDLGSSGPPSMAPDGTVWFVGPSGVERIPAGE